MVDAQDMCVVSILEVASLTQHHWVHSRTQRWRLCLDLGLVQDRESIQEALQDALGLQDEAPLDAVRLASAALADGRSPDDARLALQAFKAAGPEFARQYEYVPGCYVFRVSTSLRKVDADSRAWCIKTRSFNSTRTVWHQVTCQGSPSRKCGM